MELHHRIRLIHLKFALVAIVLREYWVAKRSTGIDGTGDSVSIIQSTENFISSGVPRFGPISSSINFSNQNPQRINWEYLTEVLIRQVTFRLPINQFYAIQLSSLIVLLACISLIYYFCKILGLTKLYLTIVTVYFAPNQFF